MSAATAAKWLSHRKRFISSLCSMPALCPTRQRSVVTSSFPCSSAGDLVLDSQSLGFSGELIALLLRCAVVALRESNPEKENIGLTEGDTLDSSAVDNVRDSNGMRRKGIVR